MLQPGEARLTATVAAAVGASRDDAVCPAAGDRDRAGLGALAQTARHARLSRNPGRAYAGAFRHLNARLLASTITCGRTISLPPLVTTTGAVAAGQDNDPPPRRACGPPWAGCASSSTSGLAGPAAQATPSATGDTRATLLTRATVNGRTLVLTYDEALDGASVPAPGNFVVTAAGSTVNVNLVSVAGSAVTLTLATAVQAGQTVTLDYTPRANPIQDTAGNDAAPLSGQTVTNNTGGGPGGPGPQTGGGGSTGGLANDSDPDGDPLTVVEVSAPAHGTTVLATTGTVEYTPEPDYHGSDRFTYVADDGSGLTAESTVDVTVLPVNDPPAAVDDAAETAEDTPATIAVLENDSDADGDTLTVAEVSAPEHGAARLTAAGTVEYTPEPDYHGSDRFTYVVGDGTGLTAQAAVAVTVLPVNDPPQALGVIPDQTLEAGDGPASLDLSPYFNDRDGDPLSYTAVAAASAVALNLAGAALTLTVAHPGAATVTVTAEDPGGLTATQAFLVTTTDRQARGVVEDTLAAMGRGHLASARATLGRRVEATGREESRVTVAGLQVPLGKGGAAGAGRAVAERWVTGVAGGMPLPSAGWNGMGAGVAPGAFGSAGAVGSPGGGARRRRLARRVRLVAARRRRADRLSAGARPRAGRQRLGAGAALDGDLYMLMSVLPTRTLPLAVSIVSPLV